MHTLSVVGLYSLLASSQAAAFPARDKSLGYVSFSLSKSAKSEQDMIKHRSSTLGPLVNARLENNQYYYQVQLGIGTPPQLIDFTIDTGSSDLWVMAEDNPYCTTNPSNTTGINCTGSVFDPKRSKTFHSLHVPFGIQYGDNTMANGSLATDAVRFGGTENDDFVNNATFAVASVGNSSTCVFGIGFIGDEAQAHVHRNGSGVYPVYMNVPTLMKQQGLIYTNAYSLWLNDRDAEAGSILFGGVDSEKYDGTLSVVPVFNNYHEYLEHPIQTRVMLNSIAANHSPLVDFNIAVLLDSGTSFSYLPNEIFHAVGASLGFTYDDSIGYYFGSRKSALSNVPSFQLDFSGSVIDIPTSDLLVGMTIEDDESPVVINGEEQVILAMGAADDDYLYILGDVFLRSIYAVFDLDHYEIGIAQSRKNATGSAVTPIQATIPGGVQAPRYVNTYTNNSSFNVHSYAVATPPPKTLTIALGSLMSSTNVSLPSTVGPTLATGQLTPVVTAPSASSTASRERT